jgi:hypothetical protein
VGLLKNAHLLCCAANRTAQRISIYASRFGFLRALHLDIFEQPQNMGFFNASLYPSLHFYNAINFYRPAH